MQLNSPLPCLCLAPTQYQYRPGLYGTIVGRYCPNSAEPNVCKECCESKDCPNVGTGQVCNAGFCSSNGCTTFKCWEIQVRAGRPAGANPSTARHA